jgi:hypothetical protein
MLALPHHVEVLQTAQTMTFDGTTTTTKHKDTQRHTTKHKRTKRGHIKYTYKQSTHPLCFPKPPQPSLESPPPPTAHKASPLSVMCFMLCREVHEHEGRHDPRRRRPMVPQGQTLHHTHQTHKAHTAHTHTQHSRARLPLLLDCPVDPPTVSLNMSVVCLLTCTGEGARYPLDRPPQDPRPRQGTPLFSSLPQCPTSESPQSWNLSHPTLKSTRQAA